MKRSEALSRMIAPSQRRPNKPRGGVIQIHVTRACNEACLNCTQGSNYRGPVEFISVKHFEQAVLSLKDYFGVVGVFGGNPGTCPHFPELCKILQQHIPKERCGLWCNNPFGHGRIMAKTFNPAVSNLNVHLDAKAYAEFRRDWPEARPFGLHDDSRHSPCFVSMREVVHDEGERWDYISRCEINRNWSALVGVFRGELRAWFCEIAGAQSMLKQHDPSYPDTGVVVRPGWWKATMADYEFATQADYHCHRCSVPLGGYGELAQASDDEATEQISQEYADVCQPKRKGRRVEIVNDLVQLGHLPGPVTDYMGNAKREHV